MRKLFLKYKILLTGVILCIILSVAFFLRSAVFFSGDFYFLPDQARDLMLVRDMLETHKPSLIGARAMSGGYFFHGPLWIWMLGIPTFIFQGDPFLISFYTFVGISLSIILLGFLATYKLYGFTTATFTAIFLTISSALVTNVSGTTNAQLMPLVCVGYLFFLILYLRKRKYAFYLAAFFAGLGVQFEGVFAVPLFIFLLLVSLVSDRYILHIRRVLLTGLSFAIPLVTFILFDVRHGFLMGQGLLRLLTDGKGLGTLPGYEQYGELGFRVIDRATGLVSVPSLLMLSYNSVIHVLFLVILAVAFWVVIKENDKQAKKELLVLSSLPVFIYIVFIYFQYPIWPHYVFAMPVVASFLFAIAMRKVWTVFVGKFIVLIVLFVLLLPVYSRIQSDYFLVTPSISSSDGSYKNQLAVVEYIFKSAGSEKFGYFVYSPQVFTYGMDYLLWWKGKYTYNYIPESKKERTFYLVMYPPLKDDLGAHAFWIKNVIRTQAKLVERKNFPGGIIVEKRLLENDEEPVDPNYYLNVR